jgi:hypothetical protein
LSKVVFSVGQFGQHRKHSPTLENMGKTFETKGTASEVAEKLEFFEGDGLQAVHNCFVVNTALEAAEERFSRLIGAKSTLPRVSSRQTIGKTYLRG